jgi:hypothetical protein
MLTEFYSSQAFGISMFQFFFSMYAVFAIFLGPPLIAFAYVMIRERKDRTTRASDTEPLILERVKPPSERRVDREKKKAA